MSLIIDKEFKALIEPLKSTEYSQLEENILKDGCRDALVLWGDILVDGHNRLEICQKHGIEFKTVKQEFEDRTAVKIWMLDNQDGRRNSTDGWQFERKQLKKQLLLEKGKQTQGQRNDILSTIDKKLEAPHNTQKELAAELGWSTGKVAMADKVWKEAAPEVKEAVKKGEVSINQAYKEIKADQKKQALDQKKEEYIKESKDQKLVPLVKNCDCKSFLTGFADDSIDCIITDPPYMTDVKDIVGFVKDWLPLAISKVKDDGRLYICTGAYPAELQAYLSVLLSQKKFIVDNPLIWAYKNTLGQTPKNKYNLNYQVIWHLYSEKTPQLDTGITAHMFNVQEINAPDGRQGDRLHTWQKPDELANRLVFQGTKPEWQIVDPFCCTGTFLLAACKKGRKAQGCDIDKSNLNIAIKRGCHEL